MSFCRPIMQLNSDFEEMEKKMIEEEFDLLKFIEKIKFHPVVLSIIFGAKSKNNVKNMLYGLPEEMKLSITDSQ